MAEILTLALPFFGLILLGFGAGRFTRVDGNLEWFNHFIVYFALPALFFRLISQTPFEQLVNWQFILTTTFATYCAFALAFAVGVVVSRGEFGEAAIQGGLGAYANVGYLGPGLMLAALGPAATVPTALIFCFDSTLIFTLVPLLMAISGRDNRGIAAALVGVVRRVVTHPFIIATALGIAAAYFKLQPPAAIDKLLAMLSGAAAPCALFAMGVRIGIRPLTRVPSEMPFLIAIKLMVHPVIVLVLLISVGGFSEVWVHTALLMAALPPAANMFVLAQQYGVYVERASSTIMAGTAISVVTVTGLLFLISNDLIPLGPG